MDDVSCTGSEDNLLSCQSNPIGKHNCNHSTDAAGVDCVGEVSLTSTRLMHLMCLMVCLQVLSSHFIVPAKCENGDLRLAGGGNRTEGRVEICVDRKWGSICDDHWGSEEAMVACYKLGFYWQS